MPVAMPPAMRPWWPNLWNAALAPPLGNALRRVLLSSLQGAAVTALQIDGVLHEFSSIPGVREDVTDIVLNVKALGPSHAQRRPAQDASHRGRPRRSARQSHPDRFRHRNPHPDLVLCTLDAGRAPFHGIHGRDRQGLCARQPETARKTAPSASSPSMRCIRRCARFPTAWKTAASDRSPITTSSRCRSKPTARCRRRRGGDRRAHPAGPAAALHQLRRA